MWSEVGRGRAALRLWLGLGLLGLWLGPGLEEVFVRVRVRAGLIDTVRVRARVRSVRGEHAFAAWAELAFATWAEHAFATWEALRYGRCTNLGSIGVRLEFDGCVACTGLRVGAGYDL